MKRPRGRPRKKTAAELFDEQAEAEAAQAEATSDEGIARAAARLAGIVEHIENIEDEMGGLKADRADIYAEAKAAGFEVSILRAIVRRRRMDKEAREEADELLRLYEEALESGAP